jgi:hypothetical protein
MRVAKAESSGSQSFADGVTKRRGDAERLIRDSLRGPGLTQKLKLLEGPNPHRPRRVTH